LRGQANQRMASTAAMMSKITKTSELTGFSPLRI
jgi:hypothetical protein